MSSLVHGRTHPLSLTHAHTATLPPLSLFFFHLGRSLFLKKSPFPLPPIRHPLPFPPLPLSLSLLALCQASLCFVSESSERLQEVISSSGYLQLSTANARLAQKLVTDAMRVRIRGGRSIAFWQGIERRNSLDRGAGRLSALSPSHLAHCACSSKSSTSAKPLLELLVSLGTPKDHWATTSNLCLRALLSDLPHPHRACAEGDGGGR